MGFAVFGLAAGVGVILAPMSEAGVQRGAYSAIWLALLIGWSFVATGIYASSRRPESRTGTLMVAVGLAWFVSSVIGSSLPLVHTIGLFGGMLWAALLIHMTLTFPAGHVRGRRTGWLIGAAYVVATVLQIPPLLFSEHISLTCRDCPRHLALVEQDVEVAEILFAFQLTCALAVLVLACGAVAARWRRATPPERHALAPVLWAGAATGVVATVAVLTEVAGWRDLSANIDWAYLLILASIPPAFLVGLLRSRIRRADAVAAFVEGLSRAPRPGDLRDGLADALGDPSLSVAYWIPTQEAWVDAAARPIELPAGGAERASLVIEIGGTRVAAIVHDASLSDEPDLVRTAGAAAALGLERERLEAELRTRIAELSRSRARIVEAGDVERRRLERDLHDGAQQRLVSLLLTLRLARRRAAESPEALLDHTEQELAEALANLRDLAHGILPPVLTDRGLAAAIEELASRSSVAVVIDELPHGRLPDPVEVAAYFVVAEALTNVAKYAQTDRARVRATVKMYPGVWVPV